MGLLKEMAFRRTFLQPCRASVFALLIILYVMIKVIHFSWTTADSNHPKVDFPDRFDRRANDLLNVKAPEFMFVRKPHSIESATSGKCDSGQLGVPEGLKMAVNCPECSQVTCRDLLFGPVEDSTYNSLREHMKQHPYTVKTDEEMTAMASNCSSFKKLRGYHLEPADGEEAEFPLAFNILMYRDVEQVEKLLRAIYRPQNVYCIHIDAKSSPGIHKAMAAIVQCFPNVFIATKLERVVYAGFSRLQADINCMQDLVKVPIKWKYLFNHAAQAFPLKTNSELVKVAKIYNGSNDVEGIYGARIRRGRFEFQWKESGLNTNHPQIVKTDIKNPPLPDDIDFVRGSAYAVFSREFVEFLLTDQKAQHLLEWSRNTYSPDEHFWATLHHTYSNPHLKTPGGYSGVPNEKPWLAVYAAWGGVDKCGGKWRHGSCVFGISDLPQLTARREHFLNKLALTEQHVTMECLEAWIEHKVQCPPQFDDAYYKSLPFIRKGGS